MGIIDWILENPVVYATWQAPFVSQKFAPVERRIRQTRIRRVLDVGCGPGTNAARFTGADYVGMDINERYLAIARSKYPGQFICADLEVADISGLGRFDTVLVNSFLHHLPDGAVTRILRQIRSILEPDGTVHILELVMPDHFSLATIMAMADRGRYARTVGAWSDLFEQHFEPLAIEPYTFGGGLWAMVYFQGKPR